MCPIKIKSIKFKFTLWYLAVLSVVLIALGAGIYFSSSRRLNSSLDRSLKTRAEQILNFRKIVQIIAGGTFEGEPGEWISFYLYIGNDLIDISYDQMNRILKPVDRMTQTARKIEETDDELGNLAHTLNMMIDRLEKAFERQKELTSDASHELRAPLAVIQAETSLALQRERDANAYRKSIEIIARETERMSGVIKQILFLARSDSGRQRTVFGLIDLERFLSTICEEADWDCPSPGRSQWLIKAG